MSVIEIRDAEREGARLVLALAGVSGGGKTFTAIELAYGLANYDPRKIGLLDTENRRGSLYADALEKHPTHPTNVRFKIGDLYAPFSPQRYTQALLAFQKAGVEVLVVDSGSHEWEGIGGCEDIAFAGNPRMPKWNDAKREHKAFVNALLASDMHIIICLRAREKVRVESGKVTPLGIMPICEKNFMFEMTASIMMYDEGRGQTVMKCPKELRPFLAREKGYLTAADGKAVRDWVDGAKELDPRVEHARNTLRTVTEQGMDALVDAWKALPGDLRAKISPDGTCPDEFKLAARDFDTSRAANDDAAVSDLNSLVMGDAA